MHRSSSKTQNRQTSGGRVRAAIVIGLIVGALTVLVPTVALSQAGARHFPRFNGKDITNVSLTGADIKNKSLTPADFRGSVRGPRGPAGQNGAPGAPGQPGQQGAQGAPGTALAYAHVTGSGGVDHAKSVAGANVTRSGTGTYCFSGLGFTPNNVVASPGYNGTAFSAIIGFGPFSSCPAGTQVTVGMFGLDGGTHDNDFMISFN